jgi:hypothetical protein
MTSYNAGLIRCHRHVTRCMISRFKKALAKMKPVHSRVAGQSQRISLRGVKSAEDIAGRLQLGSHDRQHSHCECAAHRHKSSTPLGVPSDAIRAHRAYDPCYQQTNCAGTDTAFEVSA